MEFNPLSGQTIYDMAVSLYGDFDAGVSDILSKNPSLNMDSDDYFGITVEYTPGLRRVKPVIVSPPTPTINNVYLTRNLQSVYDLSTQIYGNLSSIGKLLENFPNLNTEIPLNSPIDLIDTIDPVVIKFRNTNVIVCTDIAGPEDITADNTEITADDTTITADQIIF